MIVGLISIKNHVCHFLHYFEQRSNIRSIIAHFLSTSKDFVQKPNTKQTGVQFLTKN